MKRNDPHHWTIKLVGKTKIKTTDFKGRLDEALAEADVMESGVPFTVVQFVITRRNPIAKKTK